MPICVTFSGSQTAKPLDRAKDGGYICPVGHYCTKGAVKESKCDPGTYADEEGLGECKICRAGFVCAGEGTVDPSPCPSGSYCKNGTKDRLGERCPLGTYNEYQNRSQLSDCLLCPSGKYCDEEGLSSPNGNCHAGFLCINGSKSAEPNEGHNKPCPAGHYCVNGTLSAHPCPAGTLRKDPGGGSEDDCPPCDAGKFCEGEGLVTASGPCFQGFYCPSDAKISSAKPSDHRCPPGYYCGNGSAEPTGCEPGKYQPDFGSWDCLDCLAGKYCPSNTSNPIACEPYSYCLANSAYPTPCPNGTYTEDNQTGLHNYTQCNPCPPGHYCQMGQIVDKCLGGYICYNGSGVPNPTDGGTGELCPRGYYCPPGTLKRMQCPENKFITKTGASSEIDCKRCSAGFVCLSGEDPKPCDPGHFCPFNSTKTPCRIGTYNNKTEATDESWCEPCPAGYLCRDECGENGKRLPFLFSWFLDIFTCEIEMEGRTITKLNVSE